jgi:hypothetical protein
MQSSNIPSILFILDESGSMKSMGSEPIDSMRNFYKTQQETGKEFLSTFVTFSDSVRFRHKNTKGSEIIIKDDDFLPNGMTALYDAIGTAVDYQKNISTNNVICVILTDGQENSSRIYNLAEIKKLISDMEKEYNWQFIYLGANQDSFSVGNGLGIQKGVTQNYNYTENGLRDIMRSTSLMVSSSISCDYYKETINIPEEPPQLYQTCTGCNCVCWKRNIRGICKEYDACLKCHEKLGGLDYCENCIPLAGDSMYDSVIKRS